MASPSWQEQTKDSSGARAQITPICASEVPRELMAEIFAATLEFVEKNQEKVSGLFFGADRSNP